MAQPNMEPKDAKNFQECVNEEIREFFERLSIKRKTTVDSDNATPRTVSKVAIKADFGDYTRLESASKQWSGYLNGVENGTLEKSPIFSEQDESEVPLVDTRVFPTEAEILAQDETYAMFLTESVVKSLSATVSTQKVLRLSENESQNLKENLQGLGLHEVEIPLVDTRVFPIEIEDETYYKRQNDSIVELVDAIVSLKNTLLLTENQTKAEENMESWELNEVSMVDTQEFPTEAEIASQNETKSMYLNNRVPKNVKFFIKGIISCSEDETRKLKRNVKEVPILGKSKVVDEVQSVLKDKSKTHSQEQANFSTTLQNLFQAPLQIDIPKDCEERIPEIYIPKECEGHIPETDIPKECEGHIPETDIPKECEGHIPETDILKECEGHIPETRYLQNTEKPTSEEFVSTTNLNENPLSLEMSTDSDKKTVDKKSKRRRHLKKLFRDASHDEIFCRRLKETASLIEADECSEGERDYYPVKRDYFGLVKKLTGKIALHQDQEKCVTSNRQSSNTSKTTDIGYTPGEEIYSFYPFVCVLANYKIKTNCSHCFLELPSDSGWRCKNCPYARYCCKQCKTSDAVIHKRECQYLINAMKHYNPNEMVRAVAHLMWKLEDESQKDVIHRFGGRNYRYRDVEARAEDVQLGETNSKLMQNMYGLLKIYVPDCSIPYQEFSNLFITFYRHHLIIEEPPKGNLGIGMYLGLSSFQHSCHPTANAIFERNMLYIVSCIETESSDETSITLSFVDLCVPKKVRDVVLEFYACGVCHCSVCELGNFEYVSRTLPCNSYGSQKMEKMEQMLVTINLMDITNYDPKTSKEAACRALDLMTEGDDWDLSYVRAGFLIHVAKACRIMGEHMDCIKFYRELRIACRFHFGYFHPRTVDVLYFLAEAYWGARLPKQAKRTFTECLEAAVNTYGCKEGFYRDLRLRYAMLNSFNWNMDWYFQAVGLSCEST